MPGDPDLSATHALLVYPRSPVSYWGLQHSLHLIGKSAALPPLGLITVAALLPAHWRLRLVDLNLGDLRDEDLEWADVLLTGGLLIQLDSMREVVARARAHQLPVAVGGPAPTGSPGLFRDADVVFQGEAEGRIDDLVDALTRRSDSHVVLPAPASYPDLTTAPVPRFDLLDLSRYTSVSVQYSRGCPFRCEFCDVIEIFGRTPRVKTAAQMLAEFEAIHELGYRGTLFVVDDNFIGNRPAVRRLLPLVRDWQQARGHPYDLYTEASVDLASDRRLLAQMVEAGFRTIFLGIETPSIAALERAGKYQNLRLDPAEAIDRITRAGIEVMGGFIVGFDTDEADIFALQRELLTDLPVPLAMVGILTALPGTALWRRLRAEGRLRERSSGDQFTRPNFTPVMDEEALLRGYGELMAWLYSPERYYGRCEATLARLGAVTRMRSSTPGETASLLRTIWHIGIRSPRRRLFWRLLAKAARRGRRQIRQVVAHAVHGEHLIRYTTEHVLPRMERALAELQAEARCRADDAATPRLPAEGNPETQQSTCELCAAGSRTGRTARDGV
jgi:radical SAM superfamily enzyme YgiQ (UPF0313 family)